MSLQKDGAAPFFESLNGLIELLSDSAKEENEKKMKDEKKD